MTLILLVVLLVSTGIVCGQDYRFERLGDSYQYIERTKPRIIRGQSSAIPAWLRGFGITGIAFTGGSSNDLINAYGNFYERDENFRYPRAPQFYIHGIGYNAGAGVKIKGEF